MPTGVFFVSNRFGGSKKWRFRSVVGKVLPVLLFMTILTLFNMGISSLTEVTYDEAIESAQRAVKRAVITFYAVEGFYPPNIDVLIERYGLIIDLDRFAVHYNAFASNVMPHISIFPRNAGS